MQSDIDYRLLQYQAEKSDIGSKARNLQQPTYLYPITYENDKKMDQMFMLFSNKNPA